jgi:hypothetical protein
MSVVERTKNQLLSNVGDTVDLTLDPAAVPVD